MVRVQEAFFVFHRLPEHVPRQGRRAAELIDEITHLDLHQLHGALQGQGSRQRRVAVRLGLHRFPGARLQLGAYTVDLPLEQMLDACINGRTEGGQLPLTMLEHLLQWRESALAPPHALLQLPRLRIGITSTFSDLLRPGCVKELHAGVQGLRRIHRLLRGRRHIAHAARLLILLVSYGDAACVVTAQFIFKGNLGSS